RVKHELTQGYGKGDPRVPFFRLVNPATQQRSNLHRDSCARRLHHPVTLQALRAHPHSARGAIHEDAHSLQVRIPTPLGPIVGVADIVAGDRPFRAHGTYPCHRSILDESLTTFRSPLT